MNKRVLTIAGTTLYILSLGIFSFLLLTEPEWFDIKAATIVLAGVLLLFALGPAYRMASNAHSKLLVISGAIALAVLMTFIGLFLMAGTAWLIALSHV